MENTWFRVVSRAGLEPDARFWTLQVTDDTNLQNL
jgi:hypothetical protein